MKTKGLMAVMLGMAMIFVSSLSMMAQSNGAVSLDGKKYVGIAKIQGQPLDLWVDITLGAKDANITMAGQLNFSATYSATKTGNDINMTLAASGNAKSVLKSTDDGGSFEGKFTGANGLVLQLWVLEVPAQNVPVSLPTDEVAAIVGSSDGYTSFMKAKQDGMVLCITSEVTLDKENGKWSMKCDNSRLQKMFENFEGTYSVDGSKLELVSKNGVKLTGTIYNDGTYIEIPVGKLEGMDITFILIR